MSKLQNIRVLSIEDDPSIQLLLKRIVENAGGDFYGTSSLSGVLAAIEEQAPHIILLDIQLGDTTGIHILTNSDFQKAIQGIEVMLLSNVKPEKIISGVKKLGVKEYISKPINSKIIIEKLQQYYSKDYLHSVNLKEKIQVKIPGSILALAEDRAVISCGARFEMDHPLRLKDQSIFKSHIKTITKEKSNYIKASVFHTKVNLKGVRSEDIKSFLTLRSKKNEK